MARPSSDATSVSLLEQVRGQDQQAWQRLVALYGPLVARWCRLGGVRAGEEGDVAQEVFLAVFAGLGDFQRRRPGSFRSWVRGITRFKLADHRRRRRGWAPAAGGTAAQELIREVPDPQAGAEDDTAEVSGLYHRALELIRPEFEERTWQAFWRSAVEGHPTDLIAADLGVSAVTVRVAKSRVLGRLRSEVGDLIA
jgi:RNA polymerase sigma-70 factor (ECF subfamily)